MRGDDETHRRFSFSIPVYTFTHTCVLGRIKQTSNNLRQAFTLHTVENPILEKVRSGGSGQTFALPTKKKVSEQMEVASALTYASVLKKGLKLAPVAVHSF